jgi:hypothetical protein
MLAFEINQHLLPKKLSWFLWLICCGLVVCDSVLTFHDVTGYYVFNRIFDMTREESIPNWYASILLFCIALTCVLTYVIQRVRVERQVAVPWLFFGAFFTFLSMDDGAKIHERLGSFFRELTEEGDGIFWVFQDLLESASTYSWQIFVLPVFLFVGFFMLLWGYQHVKNTKTHGWILLGGVSIAVALSLDYFEGLVDNDVIDLSDRAFSEYTIEHYQRVAEEFLEMTGFICILHGLWIHLLSLVPGLKLLVVQSER